MKIPKTPPTREELIKKIARRPHELSALLERVNDPLVNGEYLHWDKLRHRTPPDDLTIEGWWFGIKLKRGALAKKLPLLDKSGRNFTFSLIDPLQESLHEIDSLTHGAVAMPEQVTNQETRNTYMVRSLMEESITSSQLEGASTTKAVAKEMIRQGRPPRDRSERMIYNNYITMQKIIEVRDQPLTKELLFEIHRTVTEGTLADPTGAGRFRRPDEDIRVVDDLGNTYHVPPDASELDRRVEAMCAFANGVEATPFVHPALRSMILHFWIGYEHPFIDGNGRTARAIFYWSMLKNKYWLFEFISISGMILKSYGQYEYAYLYSETDESDLTYFLEYHSRIIHRTIKQLYDYIEDKTRAFKDLQAELKGMEGLNARQTALIDHAIHTPGFRYTYESHATSHGVVLQTARTDILSLVKRGLLKQRREGRKFVFTPAADIERKLKATP
jgi:Fic family protein